MAADVLLVSLGSTAGLRAADDELAGCAASGRARASRSRGAAAPREVRTFALTDLVLGARRARGGASAGIARARAARRRLLDDDRRAAVAAARRDPLRRARRRQPSGPPRRLAAPARAPPPARGAAARARAPGALAEAPGAARGRGRRPGPGRALRPAGARPRDIAAVTYAADPEKKGLDRVLAAWAAARRDGRGARGRRATEPRAAAAEGVRYRRPLAPGRRTARCCAAPAST